jgi:hypothetical protein
VKLIEREPCFKGNNQKLKLLKQGDALPCTVEYFLVAGGSLPQGPAMSAPSVEKQQDSRNSLLLMLIDCYCIHKVCIESFTN